MPVCSSCFFTFTEIHRFANNPQRLFVFSFIVRPLSALQPANHNGEHPFLEPIRNKICCFPEAYKVDKIGFILSVAILVISCNCTAELTDSGSGIGLLNFRVAGQPANEDYFIKNLENPPSVLQKIRQVLLVNRF